MSGWGVGNNPVKWGDVDDVDENINENENNKINNNKVQNVLPARSETQPDRNGVKTVTEYYKNANGQTVKVVKRIQVVKKKIKVSQGVLERSRWSKFGDVADKPAGLEPNISFTEPSEVFIDCTIDKSEDDKKHSAAARLADENKPVVTCQLCGEVGHWTLKCPKRQDVVPKGISMPDDQLSRRSNQQSKLGDSNGPAKYVPPSRRGGSSMSRDNSEPTIRVSNLPEDVSEMDLADLFRPFGRTSRIFLAKDRNTGLPRGFAFISYHMRQHAEEAIRRLDGHGYANLILRVEWAKPRDD